MYAGIFVARNIATSKDALSLQSPYFRARVSLGEYGTMADSPNSTPV